MRVGARKKLLVLYRSVSQTAAFSSSLTNPQIDLAGIDESDSDSSTDENDYEGIEEEGDDIPISDLEDLDDEEREDIIPHQRLTINNTSALTSALKRIVLPISKMAFSEHQSLTTADPVSISDVSNDVERELEAVPRDSN